MRPSRWVAGLLVVVVAGCGRSAGHARSDAEMGAPARDAAAFAERLRTAGKAMAELEAEVRSMGPDAAIDLLRPLLDDEDPEVAEHAADLLLALESPHADRIVVLDALWRTGDGMGRRDSTGGRRIDAMGRGGRLTLLDIYLEEDSPGAELQPQLGEGCALTMGLLADFDHPDVRRALLRCLAWEDVQTAEMVGWTLADRDPRVECPRFRAMLRSDKPLERVAAIAGLYACRDARAVPALRAVLDDETNWAKLSPHRYHIRGPRDQCPPGGPCTTPEEPKTIGEHAARVIDSLTGRQLGGDAAAIEAWECANPPADDRSWIPRPLGPAAFWKDLRPIDPRAAEGAIGEACEIRKTDVIDFRNDLRPYVVEWRRCPLPLTLDDQFVAVPEFVTVAPLGATQPILAFSNLTFPDGLSGDVDPDARFDRVEQVFLRADRSRQLLVVRAYGGNGKDQDWCVVGAVGDGIGCWSQADLDGRAEAMSGPGDFAYDDWGVEVAGRQIRLVRPIWGPDDCHADPTRGRFVAVLAAHPTEPRLVEVSFVREDAGTAASVDADRPPAQPADAGAAAAGPDGGVPVGRPDAADVPGATPRPPVAVGTGEEAMDPVTVARLLEAKDAAFIERICSLDVLGRDDSLRAYTASDLARDLLARTYSVSTERIPLSEAEEYAIVELSNPEVDANWTRYVHVDVVLRRQQDRWTHVGTFDLMDPMTYADCRVRRSPLTGECCRGFLLLSCYGYGVTYESWNDVLYRPRDGVLEPVFYGHRLGFHHHQGLDWNVDIAYGESSITVRGHRLEEDYPRPRRVAVDDTCEWNGQKFVSSSGGAQRYCDVRGQPPAPEEEPDP